MSGKTGLWFVLLPGFSTGNRQETGAEEICAPVS